jgi:hypothetical protein
MSKKTPRTHTYHAEATALSVDIIQPLIQKIHPQAYLTLPKKGGYLSQRSEGFRVEEVISYRSAYTQVAGNPDPKVGLGWSTLATSVVEGLNVLDVLTADRVVAQISTVHPLEGHVPSISFLGTRFENLRIAGHEVCLHLDLDLFGDKPAGDRPYIGDTGFGERINLQHEAIQTCKTLPPDVSEKYAPQAVSSQGATSVHGSLATVTNVKESYPGTAFGHLIDVPNFGKIYLATLTLEHSEFKKEDGIPRKTLIDFKMLDIQMGCIGSGNINAGCMIVNGSTEP